MTHRTAMSAHLPFPCRYASLPLALFSILAAPAVIAQTASTQAPATTLDRVVVTASGFEQAIREAPASISVITREELENKPYHNLAEALDGIQGIDGGDAVDKTGAPSISIRGMPSDYTLLLIDGRRQNTSGNITPNNFGSTSNNFIPPMYAIERIEVIRGPMSTLYGSDAMGGVINIITRKPGQEWHGAVGMDYILQQHDEFGDMTSGNAYFSGPLLPDRLALSVWGAYYQRMPSEISYTTTNGNEIVPTMGSNPVQYDNFNLGSRLTLTPSDDHDLWLETARIHQKYDNQSGQLGTLGTGGYGPRQRYNRDQATLAWNARFGFGALENSLMWNQTETIGRLIPRGVANAGEPRTLENENIVFDTKLVTSLGAHMLTVGGQWWQAEMQDGVVSEKFEYRQWALFVEDEWRINDAFNLTVGVRNDDHSTFGNHVSPRAYLVWNASNEWVVKGGVSQGYKTPRLEQLASGINGFGGQGTIPLIGTPGLKPETSTSAELGVYYANAAGLSASVTLFNNEFKDKIATGIPVFNCSYAPSPDRPGCVDVGYWPAVDTFGQSQNIDKAVTRGAELAARVPMGDLWSLNLNYTYTDSEQKSGGAKGQPLTNTPRDMVNATLNWQATDALNLYLRGQYRSERYRGTGLAQNQLGDYKAYSLLHLGGTWVVNETVSFNAAIYNLLDKDFVDYQPYISNAANGTVSYANRYINNEDGRRFWVSVNLTF